MYEMRRSASSRSRQRIKDFALYIAICTIVIVYMVACTLAGLSLSWVILPFHALLVFGFFIETSRRFWGRAFWMLTVILLVIHFAIVPVVFNAYTKRVSHGMGFWFGIGSFVEWAIFLIVRNLILPKLTKVFSSH
jgi:hypothetical protein